MIYAITSGILGLIISLTYTKTGNVSKNFARTLVVLPILVCVVMIAVNGNLGASVAVLGAFSLVRFRSLQGTSREIGFVFFDMTVGICCAIGQLALALVITVFVCILHLIFELTGFGVSKNDIKNLRITIPENLDYSNIFDDLFEQYTHEHKLVAVKTTNMGSMYELGYEVRLLDDRYEKNFIDEVRTRNGNLTVICGRCDKNELEEL
ncbi:MAG: DUF4956 domain-containing protein [Pseudobutyrivibrio sp.]|nr:DUF4956 domain-containing protein [Pseudobutyrivibrio sp.]